MSRTRFAEGVSGRSKASWVPEISGAEGFAPRVRPLSEV